MRLSAYLDQEKMSFSDFGKLRPDRPIPRCTVRQWALGERFPRDPADLEWVEEVTGGVVTARDFQEHRLEVLRRKEAA